MAGTGLGPKEPRDRSFGVEHPYGQLGWAFDSLSSYTGSVTKTHSVRPERTVWFTMC